MDTLSSSPKARRWLRRIAWVLGALAFALALGAVFVWVATERRLAATLTVPKEELEIPTDAASVKRGERLARTRGCLECHGESGAGKLFLDAMPVMELRPTNISPGGKVASWTGSDWARAVRHCVRADGTGVPFMPCEDYRFLDDRDLGQIVAYLRTLPASDNDPGPTRLGPLGRVLFLKGDLPYLAAERLDHAAPVPSAPPEGPTVEYGRYLAAACTGCHGEHFSGGKIPGTPPEWPAAANITPDAASGLGDATEEQFVAAVTRGERRAGGTIDPSFMPWRQLADLTPDEVRALWLYLRTVPPRPAGQR